MRRRLGLAVVGLGCAPDFLVGRLGLKAGQLAATLLSSGVYAGDPGRLSALTAFPTLNQGSLLLRREKRPPIWSLREGLGSLPLGLAHNVKLLKPIKAGQSLTYADVAMDESLTAVQLRREMERLFAPAAAKIAAQ